MYHVCQRAKRWPTFYFYEPTCQITYQRAKGVLIIQLRVSTGQKHAYISTSPANRSTNFSTVFQKNFSVFQFFNYAQYLQISRIFGQF